MGTQSGSMLFVSAVIFGIGVTYFWPTMIGFVAIYLPKTGAVGMAVLGAAGMFAVSIYMRFMGGFYDTLTLNLTQVEAGRKVIMTTLYIPVVLILIFAGIHFYIRKKHA